MLWVNSYIAFDRPLCGRRNMTKGHRVCQSLFSSKSQVTTTSRVWRMNSGKKMANPRIGTLNSGLRLSNSCSRGRCRLGRTGRRSGLANPIRKLPLPSRLGRCLSRAQVPPSPKNSRHPSEVRRAPSARSRDVMSLARTDLPEGSSHQCLLKGKLTHAGLASPALSHLGSRRNARGFLYGEETICGAC